MKSIKSLNPPRTPTPLSVLGNEFQASCVRKNIFDRFKLFQGNNRPEILQTVKIFQAEDISIQHDDRDKVTDEDLDDNSDVDVMDEILGRNFKPPKFQ